MYDSVIEIIDPESGKVVAATETDDYMRVPMGGDGAIVYTSRDDVVGRFHIFVHKTSLARQELSR